MASAGAILVIALFTMSYRQSTQTVIIVSGDNNVFIHYLHSGNVIFTILRCIADYLALLLLLQGIEPNPGPLSYGQVEDSRVFTKRQTDAVPGALVGEALSEDDPPQTATDVEDAHIQTATDIEVALTQTAIGESSTSIQSAIGKAITSLQSATGIEVALTQTAIDESNTTLQSAIGKAITSKQSATGIEVALTQTTIGESNTSLQSTIGKAITSIQSATGIEVALTQTTIDESNTSLQSAIGIEVALTQTAIGESNTSLQSAIGKSITSIQSATGIEVALTQTAIDESNTSLQSAVGKATTSLQAAKDMMNTLTLGAIYLHDNHQVIGSAPLESGPLVANAAVPTTLNNDHTEDLLACIRSLNASWSSINTELDATSSDQHIRRGPSYTIQPTPGQTMHNDFGMSASSNSESEINFRGNSLQTAIDKASISLQKATGMLNTLTLGTIDLDDQTNGSTALESRPLVASAAAPNTLNNDHNGDLLACIKSLNASWKSINAELAATLSDQHSRKKNVTFAPENQVRYFDSSNDYISDTDSYESQTSEDYTTSDDDDYDSPPPIDPCVKAITYTFDSDDETAGRSDILPTIHIDEEDVDMLFRRGQSYKTLPTSGPSLEDDFCISSNSVNESENDISDDNEGDAGVRKMSDKDGNTSREQTSNEVTKNGVTYITNMDTSSFDQKEARVPSLVQIQKTENLDVSAEEINDKQLSALNSPSSTSETSMESLDIEAKLPASCLSSFDIFANDLPPLGVSDIDISVSSHTISEASYTFTDLLQVDAPCFKSKNEYEEQISHNRQNSLKIEDTSHTETHVNKERKNRKRKLQDQEKQEVSKSAKPMDKADKLTDMLMAFQRTHLDIDCRLSGLSVFYQSSDDSTPSLPDNKTSQLSRTNILNLEEHPVNEHCKRVVHSVNESEKHSNNTHDTPNSYMDIIPEYLSWLAPKNKTVKTKDNDVTSSRADKKTNNTFKIPGIFRMCIK